MKRLFLLVALSISVIACKKNDSSPFNPVVTFDYKAEVNKKLVKKVDTLGDRLYEHYIVDSGDNIVFTLNIIRDDSTAFDDEYTDVIRFEVPKDATKFSFSDNTLTDATTVYNAWGAWGGVTDGLIKDGYITGRKFGDKSWDIYVFLNVPKYGNSDEVKNIEKTFRVDE